MKPLVGVRVVELTHFIAGPLAGQNLADFGAEVIKVEPLAGDPSRKTYPMRDGESAYFASMNRGKRFVRLDLKTSEGLEAFLELVRDADILVTNYAAALTEPASATATRYFRTRNSIGQDSMVDGSDANGQLKPRGILWVDDEFA